MGNKTNNVDERCHVEPECMELAAGRAFKVMDASFHKSTMNDCCSLIYRRACRIQPAICFNGQSNLQL